MAVLYPGNNIVISRGRGAAGAHFRSGDSQVNIGRHIAVVDIVLNVIIGIDCNVLVIVVFLCRNDARVGIAFVIPCFLSPEIGEI